MFRLLRYLPIIIPIVRRLARDPKVKAAATRAAAAVRKQRSRPASKRPTPSRRR